MQLQRPEIVAMQVLHGNNFGTLQYKIGCCRLVHVVLYVILGRYLGMILQYLLLFTFLTDKLSKTLFWTNNKFVYLLS